MGEHHARHDIELSLRSEVLTLFDILHSATAVNAESLQMEGEFGVVKPGALADLLVVDGNPLWVINCLGMNGRHITHFVLDDL